MSTPPNPLDRFRSYAYHHILIAADSTEAIRALTNPDMSSDTEQSILDSLELGKKILTPDGRSSFFLVCDTRKNSYFSISDVSYTTAPQAGFSGLANVPYGELNMTLIDPSGVSLLNYLHHIAEKELQISFHKVMFLLKTIFVGHTHEGTTETIYQNAIPMALIDFQMNPSHLGSTYHAKFVPLSSGAVVYINDYSRMLDIPGIKSETNLLSGAIKSLENALNKKMREWYKQLQVSTMSEDDVMGFFKDQTKAGYGKLVQYMFTIPDDWKEFRIIGVYDKISESVYKKTGFRLPVSTMGVSVGLNTTPTTTIMEVLEILLRQCTDVQKLASNKNRSEGTIKGYKIYTHLTSDDYTVTVHYDIVNYAIPKIEEQKPKDGKKDAIAKNTFKIEEGKNTLEFDYIFSGKNTDITNFDIKVNNVNILLADNLVIGDKQTEEVNKDQKEKTNDTTKSEEKHLPIKLKPKDPVLPPAKTGSQQANMAWVTETDQNQDAVKARQQFIYNMSYAHGVSSFNVILKIRGNPDLFRRFSDHDLLPHVKTIDKLDTKYIATSKSFIEGTNHEYLSQSDKAKYREALDKSIMKDYTADMLAAYKIPSVLPFYVKVNIYGANYDVLDQSANSFSNFKPYEKMWYQGYYMVTKIEHKFVNGEFYQEMLLGSIPYDLYGNSTTTSSDTAK